MTHETHGPWHTVYEPGVEGIALKDDDILEHYTKRISRYLGGGNLRCNRLIIRRASRSMLMIVNFNSLRPNSRLYFLRGAMPFGSSS